jgi:hypothetical protein
LILVFSLKKYWTIFRPSAERKNIYLHYGDSQKEVFIISDKNLVSRIFENLLSNAIKFTPAGKNVWLSVAEENDAIRIQVKDEALVSQKMNCIVSFQNIVSFLQLPQMVKNQRAWASQLSKELLMN